MRKSTVISILVVVAVGVGLAVVVLKPFSTGASTVRHLSQLFMEDLQYKDFRSSALYHHADDQGRIDIGRALEELFVVKPELLDIMDFRFKKVQVDSSGERARVLVETRYRVLNKDDKPQRAELMLYWMKRHPDCPLGGSCVAGQCRDDRGPMRAVLKDDEEAARRTPLAPGSRAAPKAKLGQIVTCDASKEDRWVMNMDSTLKQKDYRHPPDQ